jgi:hypothetical protein
VQLSRDVQRWTGRVDKAEARLLELQAALQALAHGTLSLSLSPSLSRATPWHSIVIWFQFLVFVTNIVPTPWHIGQARQVPGPPAKYNIIQQNKTYQNTEKQQNKTLIMITEKQQNKTLIMINA